MAKKLTTKYPGVSVADIKRRDGKPGTEKAYYVSFRIDGKRYHELAGYQTANGMTAARANNYRSDRMARRVQSRLEKKAEATTLLFVWEEYSGTLGKSLKTDISNFRHLSSIEKKDPQHITRLDVSKLARSDLSAQTNAHILGLLRRIVNFGVDHDLCKPIPFRIKLPSLNNKKTEFLSPEQLEKLLHCLDNEHDWAVAGIVKMALFTGMRKGEILSLKWAHIDMDRGFLTIVNPKGGSDESIPINGLARKVLESLPRTAHEYVFFGKDGGKRSDIARGIARLREQGAFPEGFRPMHGLRHVFASLLASSGKVDMYTLQRLLTHKSPQMTQRYAHLHDNALKRGTEVMDDIFK